MAYVDLSLPDLRAYRSSVSAPPDFDDFWAHTLAEARQYAIEATFRPVDNLLAAVDTFDVSYRGFGGNWVAGWLHLPAGTRGPLPCVVTYIGYSGGRGLPHETVLFALAGYAVLVMDTRGQGGVTPDPDSYGPGEPGFVTSGILDPHTYYYRRVITDAVRAVEAARTHPLIDPARVALTGHSQGGGLTIAVAALVNGIVTAMPEVPFLCDFPRAIWITDEEPYAEITRSLARHPDRTPQALATLSYFDGTIFAQRTRVPALFSVGLMDQICPPSTVYAAYNAWAGPKRIREYAYNEHEGGGAHHDVARLQWLATTLPSRRD